MLYVFVFDFNIIVYSQFIQSDIIQVCCSIKNINSEYIIFLPDLIIFASRAVDIPTGDTHIPSDMSIGIHKPQGYSYHCDTAMAENNNELSSSFIDSLSCKIYLEILHDPVQCQRNEHYFCRKCITKHLENSETCPLCMDQLTLETLRPVPRVILEMVYQLKKPRCRHVSRGCNENVKVEDVLLHEQTCGYAPVVCSNEGCKDMVNRRDQQSHGTKECKFRKITCESCDEKLVFVDYQRHQCTLRKEMDEVKLRLDEVTESLKQVVLAQGEVMEKLKICHQSVKDLQDPLRRTSSTTFQREATVFVNGQIFIFGGCGNETSKSFEIFNWSTKTWTWCLFFQRRWSFSFIYGKKIMICGGYHTEPTEYLNPSENGYSATVASVSLPNNARCNGLLYKDRILTFYKDVVETSLESPRETRILLQEKQDRSNSARVHLFGANVYIVGGQESKMEKYDMDKNELKTLPSLPYKVSCMATVAYKDNIIIIGGYDGKESLNDVVMFNVTTQEYKRLPSMLKKRRFSTAVIMGDVIVIMGGYNNGSLNTVEYYVIGDSEWKELPAMNLARHGATACVYG